MACTWRLNVVYMTLKCRVRRRLNGMYVMRDIEPHILRDLLCDILLQWEILTLNFLIITSTMLTHNTRYTAWHNDWHTFGAYTNYPKNKTNWKNVKMTYHQKNLNQNLKSHRQIWPHNWKKEKGGLLRLSIEHPPPQEITFTLVSNIFYTLLIFGKIFVMCRSNLQK